MSFPLLKPIGTPMTFDRQHLSHATVTILLRTHLAAFCGTGFVRKMSFTAAWPKPFTPKERCQCIELHLSFAVEWVGRWPHEHCLSLLDTFYRRRQFVCPLNWCCVTWTDWHHQRRNTIQVMTMRERKCFHI